jgi:arylsulfatase A-like enzyme
VPDLLLIVTDDQRLDTVGWMDAAGRRIVDRGIRFRTGMIPTSVCCPSRASLQTGLYSHSTACGRTGAPTTSLTRVDGHLGAGGERARELRSGVAGHERP